MTRNYNYVLQESDNDCGIASLQTIFLYYDLKVSREKLLDSINMDNQGISAYDLINASKKFGLKGYGVKSAINDIGNDKLPLIAHTIKNNNFYHYIVIFENNKKTNTIKIMDPSYGISTMTYQEFNEITTDIFLIFENNNIIREKDKRFNSFLISAFFKNKKLIIQSLIFSILFIISSLIYNYYLKLIINYSKHNYLILIVLIFILISLFKNILSYIRNNIILKLNLKIDKNITKQVISHIIHLPYKYYKSKKVGELVTIVNDIDNFKDIITKIFVLCLIDLFLVLIVLIYIGFFNLIYSIILLLFILISIFINIRYQYIFKDIYLKVKDSKIKYNSNLITYLSSFDSIKNLNIEGKIIKDINNKYSDVLKTSKNYSKEINLYNFITEFMEEFIYLILIFISSLIIIKNNIDISYIVLLSNLYMIVFNFMSNISECLVMYKIYQCSIDKVLDILDIKEEKFNNSYLSNINKIEFKNIYYKTNNKDILNNISLVINKKDHLFIKGKSGVGKSTLIKLLLKYYKQNSGDILINDRNINNLDLGLIRSNITYVGQNEMIFKNNLIDNLTLKSPNKKDISLACKTVLLNEMFQDKKINYDLYLEENASNISGGERKKIIMARALLNKPSVLILDEVFNEIEIDEERRIIENIFKYYPNLTIILISHRENNIDLFNQIYELKEE